MTMFSIFKKEPKSQCDYAYEYSYITYGDGTDIIRTNTQTTSDAGNVDSFCYFTYDNKRYFVVGDHSGKLIVFDYATGIEVKSIVMKSRAKGMLRVKKYVLFLREIIEELEVQVEKAAKERLSKGIIKVQQKGLDADNQVILEGMIKDNYDSSELHNQEEESEEDIERKKKLENLKRVGAELQAILKQQGGSPNEEAINKAEEYITELSSKYDIDYEDEMISRGVIGELVAVDDTICIAFRKELYKITLKELIEGKDTEWIVDEGIKSIHDGMIKKLYVRDQYILSIANDKKIGIWTVASPTPVYVLPRESDDYYKTSFLTDNNILFVARTNEVYAYKIDSQNPSRSTMIHKLEKDGSSPHTDDVDLIQMINDNQLITVSSDGIVCIWDMETYQLQQTVMLSVQSNEQKKPLFNITDMVTFKGESYSTHYLTYGGWIVQFESKGSVVTDVSPKRIEDVFSLPYGRYNVDVTQLLFIRKNVMLAVTAESGTIYLLENTKEKRHDLLKLVESRKLSGRITAVHILDQEEGSFIITINDGTILMLKDSEKEMKRRQEMFLSEMQGF